MATRTAAQIASQRNATAASVAAAAARRRAAQQAQLPAQPAQPVIVTPPMPAFAPTVQRPAGNQAMISRRALRLWLGFAVALVIFAFGGLAALSTATHGLQTINTTPVASVTSTDRGPTAQELNKLIATQQETGKTCWYEWNETQQGFELVCGK